MSFFEGLGGQRSVPIYQLSEFQFGTLRHAANGGSIVFAVLDPAPSDPPEKRKQFIDERLQIDALVDLGILKDVSERFQESIETSRINNNNRGFVVVALTDIGLCMFQESKGKPN
jgi:hypothetical protein